MSVRRKRALAAALSLAAVLLLGAGCGEEHETEVPEGEPLELGEVEYNVQITRFLNPDDREDREYVEGQELPPRGQSFLAVFIEVENNGDEAITLPSEEDLRVVDTTFESTGTAYTPLPNDNIFALRLGSELGPNEELPEDDTAAAAGPTQGSIILFSVPADIATNRPLELEFLEGDEVEGKIELDI
jgi:hypothetical protein